MKFLRLLPVLALLLCLPIPARAQSPERIVRIQKSTAQEDGGQPLANIVFDLYHTQTGARAASLTTDEAGFTAFNFTQADQPDGTYLLVERHNPATRSAAEPVWLLVPGTDADGSPVYTQTLVSHSVPERGPGIQADVAHLDCNSGSFPVGQPHTWILRCEIPAGLAQAREYVITDVLDHRLRYETGSVRVVLAAESGEEQPLEARYYTLREGRSRLEISLTSEGMAFVAESLEGKKELRIFFDAAIHTTTDMGAAIPNDAMLEYTNALGLSYKAESDIPEVHTGGVNLVLLDSQGQPQPGQSLRLAREDAAGEILKAEGRSMRAAFVSFYTTRDLSDTPGDTVTTDRQGMASLYGLAYGTYWLVCQDGSLLKLQINETSHLTASEGWRDLEGNLVDKTLYIRQSDLIPAEPEGFGTVIASLAGLVTTGGAWFYLAEKRRYPGS